MENLKDRLLYYLQEKKLSQAKFEKKAGLSNGFVNNLGENLQKKSLEKISKSFPDLNIEWLKTGHVSHKIENNSIGNGNVTNKVNPKETGENGVIVEVNPNEKRDLTPDEIIKGHRGVTFRDSGNGWEYKALPKPVIEAKPISLHPHNDDDDSGTAKYVFAPDGTMGMRVPIVPEKAQAGYLLGFADPEFYEGDGLFIPFREDIILMQYTGLKGNGGVDVYDGDLVEIEDNEGQKCPPYIIEWSESRYNFIGRCVDGMDDMMLEEFECCNVIGNIYQNPELLTA